MNETSPNLAELFEAVADVMKQNRQAFNAADLANGDHGDHMVEIFQIAAQAARQYENGSLAEAMDCAARLLRSKLANGSAQVYGRGLDQLGRQFQERNIQLTDLLPYVQTLLNEGAENPVNGEESPGRGGEVLKALVAALAAWQQPEQLNGLPARPLDMAALFELGMAYLHAKARGGSRTEILAEAAASASPLGNVPHRHQSGRLALQTLLEVMMDR